MEALEEDGASSVGLDQGGKWFAMPCVDEEDMAGLEMDGRPRSSIGESSMTVITGSVTNETLGVEAMPGDGGKGCPGGSELKDGSLSDSFDKSFVLVDSPNAIDSMSDPSASGSGPGVRDPRRRAAGREASFELRPPGDHVRHLAAVGSLVHQLALAKRDGGCPGDAFAALMLSLQILDRARLLAAADPAGQPAVDFRLLQTQMDECVRTSEGLSGELGRSALPNVYEMVFQHALSFSRGAAADELMGNYSRSEQLYGKALDLLWFLAEEADGLELEPQIVLTSDEVMRLHQYMAFVVARRNACS